MSGVVPTVIILRILNEEVKSMKKIVVAILISILFALCIGVAGARVVVDDSVDPSILKLHEYYSSPYRLYQYNFTVHLYRASIPSFGMVQTWNASMFQLYQPYVDSLKLKFYTFPPNMTIVPYNVTP